MSVLINMTKKHTHKQLNAAINFIIKKMLKLYLNRQKNLSVFQIYDFCGSSSGTVNIGDDNYNGEQLTIISK